MTSKADPLADAARWTIFIAVLLVSAFMATRSQVFFDQYESLLFGWKFYAGGELLPYGVTFSGGGKYIGPLHALLYGLPLFLVEDYRTVNFVILATHVLAYLLLDRVVGRNLGPRWRLLFAIFYWLNPWRVYFSAFLWNPNWMVLYGALHLWTALRLRERPRFGWTLAHVLLLGLALQTHAAFVILAIVTSLLWLRGYVRIHWPAAFLGAAIVAVSLVPWLLAAIAHPEIRPVDQGFPGRGLVYVYPVVRGVLYWLRYNSLLLFQHMRPLDFTPALGAAADAVLAPVATFLMRKLALLTLIPAFAANYWFYRKTGWHGFASIRPGASEREWVEGYARWCFVGALLSFCISPTTIMAWQALIVFHAAVLPMVFWVEHLLQAPRRRWVRPALAAHVGLTALVVLSVAVASPMYRRGGRAPYHFYTREAHTFLIRLGVDRNCTMRIHENGLTTNELDESFAFDVKRGPQ